MRIVELPLALCPNGQLSLAALVNRDDGLALGYTVWLSDNYSADGEAPPESYAELVTHNRFARLGALTQAYSTSTKTIDTEVGLRVQLTGADRTIDEQSLGNGLANNLLVFVGDEILSVAGVELLSPATYRLQVIRERFGSSRGSHTAGDEVWLINRDELLALQHPAFFGGNTVGLKVALSFGRYAQDLSEVNAVTHAITNRILIEPALSNLRFNGSLRELNWSGGDVRFNWTLTDSAVLLARHDLATMRTRIDYVLNPPDPVFTAIEDYDLENAEIVSGDFLEHSEGELTAIVGSDPFFVIARRQISTPDFTALSQPIVLYITQD